MEGCAGPAGIRNPRVAAEPTILAIIQARVLSTRLPAKVLKLIQGKACLEIQLERVLRAKVPTEFVVATSDDASDDPIEELCGGLGVSCFRGDLENVLHRFYHAAKSRGLRSNDVVTRLTGDCPLHDPEIIDNGINLFLSQVEVVTLGGACLRPTESSDITYREVFTMASLEEAYRNATTQIQFEHVTPYINRQPEMFQLAGYVCEPPRHHLRWTIDEPEDFDFVCAIFDALYPGNPHFTTLDVDNLLKQRPDLLKINSMHITEAGASAGMVRAAAADGVVMVVRADEHGGVLVDFDEGNPLKGDS